MRGRVLRVSLVTCTLHNGSRQDRGQKFDSGQTKATYESIVQLMIFNRTPLALRVSVPRDWVYSYITTSKFDQNLRLNGSLPVFHKTNDGKRVNSTASSGPSGHSWTIFRLEEFMRTIGLMICSILQMTTKVTECSNDLPFREALVCDVK